jgi:hypothetical protein
MYCRYCGKEIQNDSIFCPTCGKKQKDEKIIGKTRLEDFLKEHKKLLYAYLIWFLLHLTLFLCSTQEKPNGFYPWDKSISYLLGDYEYYELSLLDQYNVYDFSEFFFYTILFPTVLFGLVKCFSFISPFLKKLKARHFQRKNKIAIKRDVHEDKTTAFKVTPQEDSINEPFLAKSVIKEAVSSEYQSSEHHNEEATIEDTDMEVQPQEVQMHADLASTETEMEIKKMPLFKRFLGSILDKVFILQVFVEGYLIISPYGAPNNLGTYIGLLNASPEIPHIGSTMELDMTITFSFIILNLVYYILCELLMSASLGKRIMEGVLFDSDNDIIDYNKVFVRGICGGLMMAGVYWFFHLLVGFTNLMVFYLFFFLMDIPVFFTKRSLLDLCTGTKYVQRTTNTIQK